MQYKADQINLILFFIAHLAQANNTRVVEFLTRDFGQQGPRCAAAKNAFTLLGQHK
jgi:hypothetical protein